MTVAELIEKLKAMPQDVQVCAYDEGDTDYADIVEVNLINGQVNLDTISGVNAIIDAP